MHLILFRLFSFMRIIFYIHENRIDFSFIALSIFVCAQSLIAPWKWRVVMSLNDCC